MEALLSLFTGAWGPIVTPLALVAVYFGYGWVRKRFPNLNLPVNPPFLPPNPLAVPATPTTPNFPVLRNLIDAAFKAAGKPIPANLLDLGATELSNLWTEIDTLLNLKIAQHSAEVQDMAGPAPSSASK